MSRVLELRVGRGGARPTGSPPSRTGSFLGLTVWVSMKPGLRNWPFLRRMTSPTTPLSWSKDGMDEGATSGSSQSILERGGGRATNTPGQCQPAKPAHEDQEAREGGELRCSHSAVVDADERSRDVTEVKDGQRVHERAVDEEGLIADHTTQISASAVRPTGLGD